MAGSPNWKIYREGEYVGCCKYPEDAAALVGMSGGVVKWCHRHVMWQEGEEQIEASQSYDEAAEIMVARLRELNARNYAAS